MNTATAVGERPEQRSGVHRRQQSSEYSFIDSAGFHHPYSSSLPPPRQLRGVQRSASPELFLSAEAPALPSGSWIKNGDGGLSPSELSPGILDLHSIDTELLSEIPVLGLFDNYNESKSFGDSGSSFTTGRQMSKTHAALDSAHLKIFTSDKEKLGSVAKIKVVVRKRPLNKKEIAKKEEDVIMIEPNSNSLTVHETKVKVDLTEYVEKHEFVFDAILDEDVSNDEVYRETVEPIVPAIFQRVKATCFAYGQTGSGKTYTMKPLPLKASQDILRLIYHTYRNQGFQLFVSFFEIYGGKLYDLVNDRRKLFMREDGKQKVCIVGLEEYRVSNLDTIKELIEKGNANRSTGTTGANEESSRSHAILQLAVKRSVDGSESKTARAVGKLSFIDLAGSERGADTTDNDKQTRIEGAEINKSLLALKECIRALDHDQVHIPFRGSKLTEVLRDSFIGDSRTVMISCISPSSGSCEHTLNTLRYADRVKSLSKGNNPKKDLPSVALRESTTLPLSTIQPPVSSLERNNSDVATERHNSSWFKQSIREKSPPLNLGRVPSGREEVHVAPFNGDYLKLQRSKSSTATEEFDLSEEAYEREKASWRRGKAEANSVPALVDNARRADLPQKWNDTQDADDDLNALLKEEEELVIAHRKLVEETLDLVRHEMNLLVEADQPGNQLDVYISGLNAVLSRKAAGIVSLKTRLAKFQRHLNERSVLI